MQLLASGLLCTCSLQLAGTSRLPPGITAGCRKPCPHLSDLSDLSGPGPVCFFVPFEAIASPPTRQPASDRQIYTFALSTHSSENWQPRARLVPDLDSGYSTVSCQHDIGSLTGHHAMLEHDALSSRLFAPSATPFAGPMGESRPIVPSLCDVVTVER